MISLTDSYTTQPVCVGEKGNRLEVIFTDAEMERLATTSYEECPLTCIRFSLVLCLGYNIIMFTKLV